MRAQPPSKPGLSSGDEATGSLRPACALVRVGGAEYGHTALRPVRAGGPTQHSRSIQEGTLASPRGKGRRPEDSRALQPARPPAPWRRGRSRCSAWPTGVPSVSCYRLGGFHSPRSHSHDAGPRQPLSQCRAGPPRRGSLLSCLRVGVQEERGGWREGRRDRKRLAVPKGAVIRRTLWKDR